MLLRVILWMYGVFLGLSLLTDAPSTSWLPM